MIYQFKVELEYEEPAVWRVLEVDSEATFEQFHDLLQLSFDWENSHLHGFSIEKKSGELVNDIEIVMNLEGIEVSSEGLDEAEEKLQDWFIHEGDLAIYTYDFGDDWRHKIVLEKILPVNENKIYPYCVEVVGVAPDEDSRGMLNEIPVKKVDFEFLRQGINAEFSRIDENLDFADLFEQAKDFNKIKPWNLLDDTQVFVVVDPISGENLYCSILGSAGYEFGMAVYIGEEGLQTLKDTQENTMEMFDIVIKQRSILLSFVDRDELEDMDYQLIKHWGYSFRGRKQWVQFRSMVPGLCPWLIDDEEARILLLALEQAMLVCEGVKAGTVLLPAMGVKDIFPARVPVGEGIDRKWSDDIVRVKDSPLRISESELLISELELARANKIERRNMSIEFDAFHLEFIIQEDERSRPHFPLMAAGLDRKNGMALYQNIFEGKSVEENVQFALMEFIEQNNFRPREIWTTSKIKANLAPLTKALKIDVMAVESLPAIAGLKEYLSELE